MIKKNPGIQAKDIPPYLGNRSLKTIERQLKILKEKSLVERRGSRKTGGYYLNRQVEGLIEELNKGLNEELKQLLEVIKKNPGIQAKDIPLYLANRSLKTIERQLKILKEKSLIERRGSRKTGGYYLT